MFKNFVKYLFTAFEEDHGKLSMKRVVVFMLSNLVMFMGLWYTVKAPIDFNWSSVGSLFILIFGFISTLLALTYIPTRNKNDNDGKN